PSECCDRVGAQHPSGRCRCHPDVLGDGARRLARRGAVMTQVEDETLAPGYAPTWASSSAEAFAHATAVIPGGVNSPVRAYGAVGGTPRFLESALGAYVRDVEGRDYVDLVGSWGPAIVGHAHPHV